jgi:hypothetical protein
MDISISKLDRKMFLHVKGQVKETIPSWIKGNIALWEGPGSPEFECAHLIIRLEQSTTKNRILKYRMHLNTRRSGIQFSNGYSHSKIGQLVQNSEHGLISRPTSIWTIFSYLNTWKVWYLAVHFICFILKILWHISINKLYDKKQF